MFDFDRWQEIANSLSRHKLRSPLTAFGVFWGVFMLVVLLGLGKGMEQGLMQLFKDWAFNSAWIEGGKTSISYQGLVPGRSIRLTIGDLKRLDRLPGVVATSPEKHLPEEYTVRFENRTGSFEIYSAYHAMAKNTLLAGRLLNPLDEAGARKVAVIGERVRCGSEHDSA